MIHGKRSTNLHLRCDRWQLTSVLFGVNYGRVRRTHDCGDRSEKISEVADAKEEV